MAGPQFTAKMQQAFAHYANDPTRNKLAAYRHAYDCSRMTVHVVQVKATELFKHPIMAQLVEQLNDEVVQEAKVDALWVLNKLKLLAEFNMAKFIVTQTDGKAVYDFSNATEEDWYCISEYTTEVVPKRGPDGFYEVEKVKLKPHCRVRAIEMIGKLTGVKAFSENIDVNALVATTEMDLDQFKEARQAMIDKDDF